MTENNTTTNNGEQSSQETHSDNQETTSQSGGIQAFKTYVIENKLPSLLWFSRGITLLFCLSYLFPFFR